MSNQTEDCLPCRLISGFGVMGMGAYIFHQAGRRKPMERNIMKIISISAVMLGAARLLNMEFLKSTKSDQS
uniref:Distal membrane-arm assembly complex protein 1-like domain-containing protein n=1 Tax=Musca domestica TaxID=7370 RepID=A0A1I8NJR4_MUSDO